MLLSYRPFDNGVSIEALELVTYRLDFFSFYCNVIRVYWIANIPAESWRKQMRQSVRTMIHESLSGCQMFYVSQHIILDQVRELNNGDNICYLANTVSRAYSPLHWPPSLFRFTKVWVNDLAFHLHLQKRPYNSYVEAHAYFVAVRLPWTFPGDSLAGIVFAC